jgi:hypothetical protein
LYEVNYGSNFCRTVQLIIPSSISSQGQDRGRLTCSNQDNRLIVPEHIGQLNIFQFRSKGAPSVALFPYSTHKHFKQSVAKCVFVDPSTGLRLTFMRKSCLPVNTWEVLPCTCICDHDQFSGACGITYNILQLQSMQLGSCRAWGVVMMYVFYSFERL